MTRRQLFALPIVAAVPAAVPNPYATVYIGKFDRGHGEFVRRKMRVPGPKFYRGGAVNQIGIVDVVCDIRKSVDLAAFRDEYAPVLKAIAKHYTGYHTGLTQA